MRCDDGREERSDEHSMDDAAAVEAADIPCEAVVQMDGVVIATDFGEAYHIRLREPPRLPEHVANTEQTRGCLS